MSEHPFKNQAAYVAASEPKTAQEVPVSKSAKRAKRATKHAKASPSRTASRAAKYAQRRGAAASNFSLGAITSASKIKFKKKISAGSIYDPIIERIGGLRVGQGFEVPLPKGVTASAFIGRLATAMQRRPSKLAKGLKVRRRATDTGGVGFACVRAK